MIDLSDFIVRQEDPKSSRKLYRHSCDNCKKDRGCALQCKNYKGKHIYNGPKGLII